MALLRSAAFLAATLVLALSTATASADPLVIGPASGRTQNGRLLTPAGRMTQLGNFPTGGALTPDGRFYWAVNTGHGRNSVQVVDVASGAVLQTLPLPGGYVGVAFAPDGRRAYVSGEQLGDPQPGGPTKGDSGDVVHVYDVDPATGLGTEQDPIALSPPAGGRARTTDSLTPTQKAYPEGLTVSPDGKTVVVALNQADQVAIIDTETRAVRYVGVGQYPFSAVIDRTSTKAYVSNELSGTLSVIDLASGAVGATIPVGGPTGDPMRGGPMGDFNAHPEGMALDPVRSLLYVAVANRDLIAVVDLTTNKATRFVDVGRPEGIGTSPVAVAVTPDGRTLFAADANEDALVAVALVDHVRPGAAGVAATPGTPATAEVTKGRPKTVYLARSIKQIQRYRARRIAARRAYRTQRRHARTNRGRAQVRRAYFRKLRRLRKSLLEGRRTSACAGPTLLADRQYRNAIVLAAARRDRALHRARGKSRTARRRRAAARRTFARSTSKARRRLATVRACGRPTPGTAGRPGTGGSSAGAGTTTTPAFGVIGRIPTAAYTQDVEVTSDGRRLVWLAGKGLGAGPNPGQPTSAGGGVGSQPAQGPQGDEYVLNKLLGRAGVLDLPSDDEIAGPLTAAANTQVVPENAAAAPAGTPVVGPDGGASSKIKHVFYVVKENRTYDQVLGKGVGGSGPQGDGRADLEAFGDNDPDGTPEAGEGVTPNLHALARRFGLLDHVFADSEVSIDGHVITADGFATDYNQKAVPQNYSGRGRAYDTGLYNVSQPPNFSVFDQAVRQGVTFRFYGEASAGTFAANNGRQNENGFRPTGEAVQTQQDPSYPSQATYGCVSGGPCFYDSGVQGSTNTPPPAGYDPSTSRFEVFRRNFEQEVQTDTLPRFSYLTLPNDHTNATQTGSNTPSALVADNDLGLGQLVDLISHSAVWKDSAIFVVEDDTQAGADHVDAHRMPSLVISPWAKGGLVSTRYDQYSVLRTAMLIAGLRPLSLNDALATPMYDAFLSGDAAPNVSPYDAIQPQQDINARNQPSPPNPAPLQALSDALPYDRQDVVPQTISDRILWKSVYGADAQAPSPGPNASPAEVERGAGAMRAYRHGRSVSAWLGAHSEDDEAGGR